MPPYTIDDPIIEPASSFRRLPTPDWNSVMIPEEYRPAVEEVVRFVTDGRILSEPFRREQFHDFPCEVVYDTGDRTPYQVTDLPESKCEVEWQDVLVSSENEHCPLRALSAKKHPVIRSDEFTEMLNEITLSMRETIESQLAGFLPKDDLREIALHFNLLIQTRAVLGAGHSHLIDEKFFNVYKAGGYPCGWIGEFPDGKLVVFSR